MEKEMERLSQCCLGENRQGEQADMQDLGVEPLAFIHTAPGALMADGINLTCSPLLVLDCGAANPAGESESECCCHQSNLANVTTQAAFAQAKITSTLV